MVAFSNAKGFVAFNAGQTPSSTMTRQDSFPLLTDELRALIRCDRVREAGVCVDPDAKELVSDVLGRLATKKAGSRTLLS